MKDGDTIPAPGILMNRMICSGAPCVSGRRIMTEVLAGRFLAGDSVVDLEEDYDLTAAEVEAAIRFEFSLARKRKKRPRA